MSQNNDLYRILNLKPECTLSEIRNSFRKLSLSMHPDKNKNIDPKIYEEIILAYNVLSNSDTRKDYDHLYYMQKSNKEFHDLKSNCLKHNNDVLKYDIQDLYKKYPHLNVDVESETTSERYNRYNIERQNISHNPSDDIQTLPSTNYKLDSYTGCPDSATNSNTQLQTFKHIDQMYNDSDNVIEDKFSGINAQQEIEILPETKNTNSAEVIKKRIKDYNEFDISNIKYEKSCNITDDVLRY